MTDDSITRVNYFEGQFLRTQDFTDEQAYHVAMRRRHNLSQHAWGIVSGLEVVQTEGNFYVQPGAAVDGYGRELILAEKKALPPKAFEAKGSKELDVWLIYDLQSSDQPPQGYAGCVKPTGNGNGNSKSNGQSFYRWQETAQVILERPDADFPNRRQPEGVAVQDRNFDASRTPPDSPQAYWPVFLGQIINDPANPKEPLAVKLDNRPYVGLVGESISAPSGRTLVQLGSEIAEDDKRFVVSTRDESPAQSAGGVQTPRWLPRLAVDKDGEVSVCGDASIYGNLIMAGGSIEFDAGTARADKARPWNIYHLSENGVEELRIEMAAPSTGGITGNNSVVIGAWFKGPDETGQETEMFHPCLTILDDGTVKVDGKLIVTKDITARTIIPAPLSAAAANASASALMSGILATTSRLPAFPTGEGALDTASLGGADAGEAIADRMAADSVMLAAFVVRMKQDHPDETDALRLALS